jgi:hypothetical protein
MLPHTISRTDEGHGNHSVTLSVSQNFVHLPANDAHRSLLILMLRHAGFDPSIYPLTESQDGWPYFGYRNERTGWDEEPAPSDADMLALMELERARLLDAIKTYSPIAAALAAGPDHEQMIRDLRGDHLSAMLDIKADIDEINEHLHKLSTRLDDQPVNDILLHQIQELRGNVGQLIQTHSAAALEDPVTPAWIRSHIDTLYGAVFGTWERNQAFPGLSNRVSKLEAQLEDYTKATRTLESTLHDVTTILRSHLENDHGYPNLQEDTNVNDPNPAYDPEPEDLDLYDLPF